MRHTKKKTNHKRRRYKRIIYSLIIILLILIATLTGIILWKRNEEAQAKKAEKAKIAADAKLKEETEKKALEEQQAQKEAEEAARLAAEKNINKDIQTGQNTATEENHKTNGLAICMYHYVYDKSNPPEDLNNNYIDVQTLEGELQYLTENNYYFPTWEEVRQYVSGEILLPEKSVVLTFDDGSASFLDLGVPLFNKYKVPVTSFLIASYDGESKVSKYASEYLTFQSHSYDMHRAGGNIGHGGIFPAMGHDEAVTDLQQSIQISGNGDAFAYPFGDYTDSCVQAVKDAGFKCAVTTEYGRAKPGDNPLLLSRIRMLEGQSLESFIKLVE